MKVSPDISAHGVPIPGDMIGELRDSSICVQDHTALQERLAEDGYLYLKNVLNHAEILTARHTILAELAAVGEINQPSEEGVSSGSSQRAELIEDLGAFWKSLSEHPDIRRVTHAGPIQTIMTSIFDHEVRLFDFLWLRAMHPGRASAYHFDHVYMNRGTDQLLTTWIPFGDVALDEGPPAVMEGSHTWTDLIEDFRGLDVDRDKSRQGHVTLDPVSLAREQKTRLLSAEFSAGDMVVFPMFTLHGSLDNRSSTQKVRISADTRFQPADQPIDHRWVGENPIGHGSGYASMGSAQPATTDPLFR